MTKHVLLWLQVDEVDDRAISASAVIVLTQFIREILVDFISEISGDQLIVDSTVRQPGGGAAKLMFVSRQEFFELRPVAIQVQPRRTRYFAR